MTPTLPSTTDAYNALQSFNSSRPQATDYIKQANDQYNVPQDQSQVTGLQGSVNNLTQSLRSVAPSVQGRTSGTFTTAGQQSALINKEQAPIAQNLTDTNMALGNAQTNQGHDEQLANQMVTALLGQDSTKYSGLLDQYNAANDSAKQAESIRQFNAQQAESQREFDLTPHGSATSDIAALLAGLQAGNKSAAALDPTEQYAVNNVNDIIKKTNGDVNSLISDYAATAKSASYGNTADKAKLQAYALARPDLFGSGGSGLSKANALISTWDSAPSAKTTSSTRTNDLISRILSGNKN